MLVTLSFLSSLLSVLFIGVHTQEWEEKEKYTKVMLIRIVPKTLRQIYFLEDLKAERMGLLLQFWRHPDKPNRHVDVLLAQTSLDKFKRLLSNNYLPYKVLAYDIVQKAGDPVLSMNNIEDYDTIYQELVDMTSEMRRLALAYKDTVSLDVIGKSFEGNPIYKVHIHRNISDSKPILFVLCGSHSREWLGSAACQYLLRKLVFDQQYDRDIDGILSKNDIVMIPMLNPDGYMFTTKSRMWRKTRSKTDQGYCRGVDMNRNFNYRWGGSGSSPDHCEETYCGKKPFSEKELLALARFLYKIRRKIVAFVDIHTYGQLWMSPWGFTTGFPKDYKRHETALNEIQRAIFERNGVSYAIGRSAATLAPISGNALDWVYGRLKIVHSYAAELRPHADVRYNGFEESGREIVPSGEDLLVGIKTISDVIWREQNERHY